MNTLYQAQAREATRKFNAIYGKGIDEDLTLQMIENFLNAYKAATHRSYNGAIEQGDIAKALNAATLNPARFTEPDAFKAYFERKDRATAERVTFADVITALVSKTIAERFGI